MDLKDLKMFAKELLKSEKSKLSDAQVVQIFKTLIDTELKILEMDFKHNKDENIEDPKEDEDDDSQDTGFSLKAVGS